MEMAREIKRFPKNDIMSLTEETPRFDLAESVGPDLQLRALLGDAGDLASAELALCYGTAAGNPALRQVVAELHGVAAEDVVVTVGGMHALFLIAFILLERGDEVVTTRPLFPNTRATLEAVGSEIKTLRLSFDAGYRLDLEALRGKLSARTRLVSLATPQNPSGVAIPLETLRQVIALMDQVSPDGYLLVDETYREAVYGEDVAALSSVTLGPKVISCASLSKCHGAPGLRLGWAITRDRALREQLVIGKFNTVVSCSTLDEAMALRVFQQRDAIIGARRKQLSDGLARTADWAAAQSDLADWLRPEAGALCCFRLKPEAFDGAAVERFYAALAEEGVRVANGTWFGEEQRIFRLGFGLLTMPDLEAGLAGLTAALRLARRKAA
jgi:aspartate/methionine/tyrosine aminotransferase